MTEQSLEVCFMSITIFTDLSVDIQTHVPGSFSRCKWSTSYSQNTASTCNSAVHYVYKFPTNGWYPDPDKSGL